jgi:hypothetical protein
MNSKVKLFLFYKSKFFGFLFKTSVKNRFSLILKETISEWAGYIVSNVLIKVGTTRARAGFVKIPYLAFKYVLTEPCNVDTETRAILNKWKNENK